MDTRRVEPLQIVEWQDGRLRAAEDDLVREEPLEIRVKGTPISVTMRTPGDDEELALGFLVTEGLISGRDEVQGVELETEEMDRARGNVVDVVLRPGVDVDVARLSRHVFAASSCGICGKASIDSIRIRGIRPPASDVRLDPAVLCQLPDRLRAGQTVFGQTGGLHAAGLFDLDGHLLAIREDVGRHNAVDKIIGHALLTNTLPLSQRVLVVSGRGGFEIIQKAIVAGIPIVASVSAPSSLAVQLARDLDQTLVGFLRGSRFVVYADRSQRLALNGGHDV